VKRLQFFDRVSSAVTAKKGGGVGKRALAPAPAVAPATKAKPPPSSSAPPSIAALLARPLGSGRILKGTKLGLSPSALRRAKRKARAAGALRTLRDLGGLAAAVEEATAASAAPPPPTPNFSRGRVRMAVGAAETARLTTVVSLPAFRADPVAAIGAHLAAAAPPVPAGRARAGSGAGAGAGADPERTKQQRIRRRREAKVEGKARKRAAMATD